MLLEYNSSLAASHSHSPVRLPRPKVLPSFVAHVAQKAQLESKLSYLRWPAQEVEIKSDVNDVDQ